MSETVKNTVVQEGKRVQQLTKDAVQSAAYLYPIKGIAYYLAHRSLWKPLGGKIVPCLALGVGILSTMFFFTYLPQAAVLTFTDGPAAAVTAAVLVLSESSTIFISSAKSLLIEDSLVDTFDGTLVSRSETALVASQRKVHASGADSIARLGKLITKPFARFTPTAIARYLMYLPLNLIPVVGTALFILAQGKRSGPSAHARYFQLKGMGKAQRERFVEERVGAYTGFGIVASLLEMVPVVGILFTFTNATGAALWAADLEREQARGTTAPELRESARQAE